MTDIYEKFIAAAYRSWLGRRESSRAIAERLLAGLLPEELDREIARLRKDGAYEVEIARENAREVTAQLARYQHLVGSPEHFVRLKEEMNARQKAQDDRELSLRWRETYIWSTAPINDAPPASH